MIRLQEIDGFDKQKVFHNMKEIIEAFLEENELKPLEIVLSEELPQVEETVS